MNYNDQLLLDFIVEDDFPPSDFPRLSPTVENLKVVATFAFNTNFTECAFKLPSGDTGQFSLEQA